MSELSCLSIMLLHIIMNVMKNIFLAFPWSSFSRFSPWLSRNLLQSILFCPTFQKLRSLMYVHKEIMLGLDLNDITNKFAGCNQTRGNAFGIFSKSDCKTSKNFWIVVADTNWYMNIHWETLQTFTFTYLFTNFRFKWKSYSLN